MGTQMDEEHVGLFDIVRDVEADRNNQELWDSLQALYNEHFRTEEALFTTIRDNKHDIADHRQRHLGLMNTVKGAQIPITEEMTDFIKNWLAQHIKNTDFTYKGLLQEIHPIPTPFKWNSFFAVFYQDMDDDHKVLFSCLADVEANPSDEGILASCRKSYQDHFKAETDLLAKSFTYPKEELYQHINKHNILLNSMAGLTTPVSQKWIDFAKNWLTQHIPNTDFRYKNMMPFPVAYPYVWDESFEVFHKRLDDEHIVLFDIMQQLKDNPEDVDILNNNRDVFRDHFDYEEKQFMECGEACDADAHKLKHDIFFKTLTWVTNPVSTEYMDWAMNWLAQHIKNTDFGYKGSLKHETPEPYVWDESFKVDYSRLDEEHDVLFANILAVSQHPDDAAKLQVLKDNMQKHFDFEEQRFCNVEHYNCVDHKAKHYKFW